MFMWSLPEDFIPSTVVSTFTVREDYGVILRNDTILDVQFRMHCGGVDKFSKTSSQTCVMLAHRCEVNKLLNNRRTLALEVSEHSEAFYR